TVSREHYDTSPALCGAFHFGSAVNARPPSDPIEGAGILTDCSTANCPTDPAPRPALLAVLIAQVGGAPQLGATP
ncbi:hypothetical protein, partial [Aeromonas sp. HMWF014]|uniref:hypothetical protein n=1 Tax=Aeromonas sp. HMWF014 TaxID=2056850 RepID=UPI001C62E948